MKEQPNMHQQLQLYSALVLQIKIRDVKKSTAYHKRLTLGGIGGLGSLLGCFRVPLSSRICESRPAALIVPMPSLESKCMKTLAYSVIRWRDLTPQNLFIVFFSRTEKSEL